MGFYFLTYHKPTQPPRRDPTSPTTPPPPTPTLQPNMREMVLLVQATLQWHSMGEKHSTFLLGDILSTPGQFADSRLLRERCRLLPRRPPPAAAPPAAPPPPPPPPPASPPPPLLLLLLLPALTIRPHSSHRSITAGRKRLPELFLHSGRTSPSSSLLTPPPSSSSAG